jgi:hypothetical protein
MWFSIMGSDLQAVMSVLRARRIGDCGGCVDQIEVGVWVHRNGKRVVSDMFRRGVGGFYGVVSGM